jgi:hypothetical protein
MMDSSLDFVAYGWVTEVSISPETLSAFLANESEQSR